jgi:ATP-dependent helicase/nuclease subunit A
MAESRDEERDDARARDRALDVRESFLVQAPAGSGKTGLLIQRFLALLAHVDRPERIVAMTFTRKAAAEMRERVLQALRAAAAGDECDGSLPHDVVTRRLALAALAQDARHDWQLVAHPSRLRMLTIDALATALARSAPLATGLGALPDFVDDASALHVAAVRHTLAAADAGDPAWLRFLAHVDNDADAAVGLLAAMLARRDQWLRLSLGVDSEALRRELERALRAESDAALGRAAQLFPQPLVARLPALARHAAGYVEPPPVGRLPAGLLAALAARASLPPVEAAALGEWEALGNWLLTKNDPAFRQRVTVNDGFPPQGSDPGRAERAAALQAMKQFLSDAAAVPGLAHALHAVRTLPPARYGDAAWSFVEATLRLLPRVAASLLLVFGREGKADFSEATLRALAALGEADDPGDLLLAMDFQIAHLLVDEFQDTSTTHLALIAKLTSGWEHGDGRSLFAVGDPMQSIYRFREAQVGIFLDAQASGRVAGVDVTAIGLARNFRSQRPVVDWVNEVFAQVLPAVSDPGRGEVAYRRFAATRDDARSASPSLAILPDRNAEAARVVQLVRAAQAAGSGDIAILVRARSHLDAILPALRREGIAFTAVELESLAERLSTRDLVTLTRALTQPADRLAALALLRAPWCGLTLADLVTLADAANRRPVLAVAADPVVTRTLSGDGRARVARLLAALAPAWATRGQASLARRARSAWLALGGPACGDGDVDLAGAESFFALLAQHDRGGDLADWDAFARAAGALFAEPEAIRRAGVQVMTLHKAKGLEFDTVILPGLARATRSGEDPALRWKERAHDGRAALLLAPLRAREGAASAPDPVYRYLKALDAEEDAAELGRLLYVGCTRAQRALHLVAALDLAPPKDDQPPRWRTPPARSALARLWSALNPALPEAPAQAARPRADVGDDVEEDATPQAPQWSRLPLDWTLPEPARSVEDDVSVEGESGLEPPFDWAHTTSAAIGTIAHRLFAQIGREGLAAWDAERVRAQRARVLVELAGEGVDVSERAAAAASIEAAVSRVLEDGRGRWLYDPAHAEGRSEWALCGLDGARLAHVSLDRTFVSDGVRWIVDFKTGRHEGGDANAFLDREAARYRDQLERYARLVRAIDARPIHLALYFPRVDGGWRAWPFVG